MQTLLIIIMDGVVGDWWSFAGWFLWFILPLSLLFWGSFLGGGKGLTGIVYVIWNLGVIIMHISLKGFAHVVFFFWFSLWFWLIFIAWKKFYIYFRSFFFSFFFLLIGIMKREIWLIRGKYTWIRGILGNLRGIKFVCEEFFWLY